MLSYAKPIRAQEEHEHTLHYCIFKIFTTLSFEYFFNSLESNVFGQSGALLLAHALKVNQSLRRLE